MRRAMLLLVAIVSAIAMAAVALAPTSAEAQGCEIGWELLEANPANHAAVSNSDLVYVGERGLVCRMMGRPHTGPIVILRENGQMVAYEGPEGDPTQTTTWVNSSPTPEIQHIAITSDSIFAVWNAGNHQVVKKWTGVDGGWEDIWVGRAGYSIQLRARSPDLFWFELGSAPESEWRAYLWRPPQ